MAGYNLKLNEPLTVRSLSHTHAQNWKYSFAYNYFVGSYSDIYLSESK